MESKKVLFNITFKLDFEIEGHWLNWMTSEVLPGMMYCKNLIKGSVNKVLYLNEEDGATYSVQFLCDHLEALQQFYTNEAVKVLKEIEQRYEGKYVTFESVMEVEEEFFSHNSTKYDN